MVDCRKCQRFSACYFDNDDCIGFVQKPMTNADAIRQMTDDELYEFLLKVQIGDIDYSVAFCDMCKKDGGNELGLDCDGCFKHWLKQDAETHFQGLHTPCGPNSDVM